MKDFACVYLGVIFAYAHRYYGEANALHELVTLMARKRNNGQNYEIVDYGSTRDLDSASEG
jgi:hypothetical protein